MELEGVLAITFIFGGGTLFLLSISPIGKAIAERIRGKATLSDDRVQSLQETQDHLLDEVEGIRAEFADLQERMDFTERLIARNTDTRRLAQGNDVEK